MMALSQSTSRSRSIGIICWGREDLRNDPRFKTNAARVAHIDETDALVSAWTQTLSKIEVFTITKQHRIPCAPVRDVGDGADRVAMTPSPKLGQHNADIYGGWLGLSPGEIADLRQIGVI